MRLRLATRHLASDGPPARTTPGDGNSAKQALSKRYGSLRDFTQEILEHLRHRGTTGSESEYKALLATVHQIRLDSS